MVSSVGFSQVHLRQFALFCVAVSLLYKLTTLFQTSWLPYSLYAISDELLRFFSRKSYMQSLPQAPSQMPIFHKWLCVDVVIILTFYLAKIEMVPKRRGNGLNLTKLSLRSAAGALLLWGIVLNRLLLVIWFHPSPPIPPGIEFKDLTDSISNQVRDMKVQDVVSGRDPNTVDFYKVVADPEHVNIEFEIKHTRSAVAALNNKGRAYCINIHDDNDAAYLPLRLKGLPPWDLVMSRADFTDPENAEADTFLSRIHMRDLTKMPKDTITENSFASLRVTSYGVYRINGVYDADQVAGRTPGQNFSVVHGCPQAFWGENEETAVRDSLPISHGESRTPNRLQPVERHACVGHKAKNVLLQAVGIPNLTVQYMRKQADGPSTVSEVIIGESEPHPFAKADPDALQQYEISHPLELDFPTAGTFKHEIVSVKDGLGTTLRYGTTAVGDAKIANFDGDSLTYHIHPPPNARFSPDDSNPDGSLRIPVGDNCKDGAKAHFLVVFKGQPPFDLDYSFQAHDAEADSAPESRNFRVEENVARLPVYNAGIYTLTAVKDAHCSGRIGLPASRKVLPAYPPTLKFEAQPIYENCVGSVGTSMTFMLTGTPPFVVQYHQIRAATSTKPESKITRSINTSQSRHTMEVRPTEPGEYSYEFFLISDFYYPDGYTVHDATSTQVVHPQSSATIVNKDRIHTCPGQIGPLKVPVKLSGSAPWDLLVRLSTRINKVVWEQSFHIADEDWDITFEPPETAGRLTLELVQVTDQKGCSKLLENEQIEVQVMDEQPTVTFGNCSVDFLRGAEGALPITFTGTGPFNITLQKVKDGDHLGEEIPLTSRGLVTDFRRRDEGTFKITSLKDKHCNGIVTEPSQCTLKYIPLPTVFPDTQRSKADIRARTPSLYEREPICEDALDHFSLKFSGGMPFKFSYDILLDGKLLDSRSLAPPSETATLRLRSSPPGTYTYRVNTVGDRHYDNSVPAQAEDGKLISLVQKVLPSPVASFRSVQTLYKCQNEPLDSQGPGGKIPLELQGQGPFTVVIEIQRVGSGAKEKSIAKVLSDITGPTYMVSFDEYLSDEGAYDIRIASVKDSRGCDSGPRYWETAPDSSVAKLRIQVTGNARGAIASTDFEGPGGGVCVGDSLHLELVGKAPYFVSYEFGKGVRHLEITDPSLPYELYLDEPGRLRLLNVCHIRPGHCCSIPTERNEVEVRPLPYALFGSSINDTKPTYFISEDEEAQVAIQFQGTPPFTLEYIRKYRKDVHGEERAETFIETNVMQNTMVLKSQLEGSYKAISVSDKYCRWPSTPTSRKPVIRSKTNRL